MTSEITAAVPQATILDQALDLAKAYIGRGNVSMDDLPKLVQTCVSAIEGASKPAAAPVSPLEPAVPVRKSVHPDFLICLEDGKKFKSLKRHLRTHYNLSPEKYREKWGLPADYPMVAPSYSATRSQLAKDNGLGRKANPRRKAA